MTGSNRKEKQRLLIKTTHAVVSRYVSVHITIGAYSNKVDFILMGNAQMNGGREKGGAVPNWETGTATETYTRKGIKKLKH